MISRKRTKSVSNWLSRLAHAQILKIPVVGWAAIGILAAFCVAWLVLRPVYGVGNATTQITTVDLDGKMVQDYTNETGVSYFYSVSWHQDGEEIRCRVPEHAVGLWMRLQVGQRYELTVTKTRAYCFVNDAREVSGAK